MSGNWSPGRHVILFKGHAEWGQTRSLTDSSLTKEALNINVEHKHQRTNHKSWNSLQNVKIAQESASKSKKKSNIHATSWGMRTHITEYFARKSPREKKPRRKEDIKLRTWPRSYWQQRSKSNGSHDGCQRQPLMVTSTRRREAPLYERERHTLYHNIS